MGMDSIKKAIQKSSHSNRLFVSMGAGAVIAGAVAGPIAIHLGVGWGAIDYPAFLVTVKVGGFVKETYQSYKHSKTSEEKEQRGQYELLKSVKVHCNDEPRSNYARFHDAGIPVASAASNGPNFTPDNVLKQIAGSKENFAADVPFSSMDGKDPEQNEV